MGHDWSTLTYKQAWFIIAHSFISLIGPQVWIFRPNIRFRRESPAFSGQHMLGVSSVYYNVSPRTYEPALYKWCTCNIQELFHHISLYTLGMRYWMTKYFGTQGRILGDHGCCVINCRVSPSNTPINAVILFLSWQQWHSSRVAMSWYWPQEHLKVHNSCG